MGVLQNCPNCGSALVMQNRKKGKYRYECGGDCWTRTKWFWSENEAAYAWNKLVKEPNEGSRTGSAKKGVLFAEAADAIEKLSRENGSLAKSVNEASESLRQRRPVVLCRDCKHRDPEDHKCDSGGVERQGCPFEVADDYFCAYGEKMEES